MTPDTIPHLCGGILFDLLLEARKPRRKARNKLNGGSDGLTAPGVYAGLIHVVTGEDVSSYAGTTMEKCASDYKKCESSKGIYVPFTDPATQSAFDSKYKRKDPDLLKRMSGFIDTYLNSTKCEWLTRAIIETMQKEGTALDEQIAVSYTNIVIVRDLHNTDQIIFLPFLLSVLHFVVINHPDCESGRPTFESWYSQSKPGAEWKFQSNIGNGIAPMNVSTDLTVPETPDKNTEAETGFIEEQSDHDVISESLTRTVSIFADTLGAAEHQMAEQIRQNQKKQASSEEEPAVEEVEAEVVDEAPEGQCGQQNI